MCGGRRWWREAGGCALAKVSVILPTYNRAALLPEALASVLGQTHGDLELVVVDDGSTDDTRQVVAPFLADGRVRYFFQPNQGLAATRNRGVAEASGDLLAFLDSDDAYPPDALERHLAVLVADPGVGMTVGGYDFMDADGQHLGRRRPWEEGGQTDLTGWLFHCYTMPGAVMLRRQWFERAGGFDAGLEVMEDWDLFMRLAALQCPMAWVPASVCRYRIHADTLSGKWLEQRDTALRILGRVFEQAGEAAGGVEVRRRAMGWVHVGLARKYYEAGQVPEGQQALRDAVRMDAGLAGERKVILLEALLTPKPYAVGERAGAEADAGAGMLGSLPEELGVGPGDVRKARARVAMARFFAAVGRGEHGKAARWLREGLREDVRWAANRGVMGFVVRYPFRHSRGLRLPPEPGQVAKIERVTHQEGQ